MLRKVSPEMVVEARLPVSRIEVTRPPHWPLPSRSSTWAPVKVPIAG